MKQFVLLAGTAIISVAAGLSVYFFNQQQAQSTTNTLEPSPAAVFNAPQDMIGQQRPDFTLPDLNGQQRHISEWDGLVVALNFWATWCPPCLKEIPEFIALQTKYADQGLQFIGVALQQAEDVTDFVQTHGMNYPVLVGEMAVIKLTKDYGNHISALPYTVIIDRQGQIAYVKHGLLAGEVAEKIINTLL